MHLFWGAWQNENNFYPELWIHRAEKEPNLQVTHPAFTEEKWSPWMDLWI